MTQRPTRLAFSMLLALLVAAVPMAAAAKPLSVEMTGAAEVPGPGDPDGSGTATFKIKPGKGEICYTLSVTNIAAATAAHIHVGSSAVAGPVVVALAPPTTGTSSACASVDPDLARQIARNPANYYVNVHNAEFPGGAVRGQLG